MNAAEFGLIFSLIFKHLGEPRGRISNQKCFFCKTHASELFAINVYDYTVHLFISGK